MNRIATLVVVALASATAHAQPVDVPALGKLVEKQPADMDRATWKEKRRDAARKLAQSKDKRAVPILVKLAETETFDIIGEIAIEGLGNIGDPSAAPTLQKIANDPAREKVQRDLARKALGKLGAPATPPPPPPPDPVEPPPPPPPDGGTPPPPPDPVDTGGTAGSTLIGERPQTARPTPPAMSDDTIAAYDRLTFAAGTAHLGYDTVRKRTVFDIDATATWLHRVEREKMAFGWDAGARVVAGVINPEGRPQTRGTQILATGRGEARFYAGQIYGIGKAAVGVELNYIADIGTDPTNDLRETRKTADLQIAIGGGYGRVLDVGGAIRVRRLSRTLDAARALGKPISPAVARDLQLAWWALRGERSTYAALVTTVAILREAGILLGEPDAGLAYEILAVLRDSQLFLRPSGLDVQVVVGEGYLIRPDDPMPQQSGRVEQLLASVGYGEQLADDTFEVSATSHARLRLFAPDDQPAPWAIGGTARIRRFTYGAHGDPFGALDLSATALASKDNPPGIGPDATGDELGLRLEGQLGFTYWMNQASGVRLAATVAADGGELFVGAQLEATYGLLDATFSGR